MRLNFLISASVGLALALGPIAANAQTYDDVKRKARQVNAEIQRRARENAERQKVETAENLKRYKEESRARAIRDEQQARAAIEQQQRENAAREQAAAEERARVEAERQAELTRQAEAEASARRREQAMRAAAQAAFDNGDYTQSLKIEAQLAPSCYGKRPQSEACFRVAQSLAYLGRAYRKGRTVAKDYTRATAYFYLAGSIYEPYEREYDELMVLFNDMGTRDPERFAAADALVRQYYGRCINTNFQSC